MDPMGKVVIFVWGIIGKLCYFDRISPGCQNLPARAPEGKAGKIPDIPPSIGAYPIKVTLFCFYYTLIFLINAKNDLSL